MVDRKGSAIPWQDITPELLKRYSAPAPRYTSYPTAPQWTDRFGKEQYAEALAKAAKKRGEPLSVYLHAPFCKSRCLYCGCASWINSSKEAHDRYLDSVDREAGEIASLLEGGREIKHLHWGGGTPTAFDPPRIERLFDIVASRFSFSNEAEIAIEVSPNVTTEEQIELLGKLGFNRMSMGVQDFSREVQEAIGRVQSVETTKRLFDKARSAGFGGINFDLMYGLPLQRPESWVETLETVVKIGPDRLAVFGYAHVPWMRPHQKELESKQMPDTDERFELFRIAHDLLTSAGYVYIGMDHFARPDDELAIALDEGRLWRNFQGYTVMKAEDLVGLGVTSISDVAGCFAQNISDLDEYERVASADGLATYRGLAASMDDKIRRYAITDIMCNLNIEVKTIEDLFGIDFWGYFAEERPLLQDLASEGLIEIGDRSIEVKPIGRIFVRQVGMAFDRYAREQSQDDGPKYSRTV